MEWAVITPEFPPAGGGVSDYSALVARQLVRAGDKVTVWSPGRTQNSLSPDSPRLVGLTPGFRLSALNKIRADLARLPAGARLLVQYAPHAFGYKGMNVPLVTALSGLTRNPLDVMFHEVAYPLLRGDSLAHQGLSIVQFRMARRMANKAHRVFVSTEAWRPLLENWVRDPVTITWLPVPSNLPTHVAPEDTAAARERFGENRGVTMGHFSTYSPGITQFLSASVPALLQADPGHTCVLLGRGARRFHQSLSAANPTIASQLFSFESTPAPELAALISACDVMLQPYPDGVSGRRTTVMAPLALGVPTATTEGALSEALWRESGGVVLSPADSILGFAPSVEELLQDPIARARLGHSGKKLYDSAFDVSHTVRRLRHI